MKKNYINPNIEVIKIQTVKMLAESLGIDETKEVKNTSDLLGREDDFDFEEED